MHMRKVLIVHSHPRRDSFNKALGDALQSGLQKYDTEVKVQDLYGERFDPVLHDIHDNEIDETTRGMQANIRWAEDLVFVFPLWWSGAPAMLKGYFDRVFTENFSFRYNQAGVPEGLLQGKRAFMLVTCDTPPAILELSGRMGGLKSIVRGVFKLCGIKDIRYRLVGSVLASSPEKRRGWIHDAKSWGEDIGKPDTAALKLRKHISSLTKAVRLPLYSFVFFTVLLGAAVGTTITGSLHWWGFFIAALIGLLAHGAVSFSNEVVDEPIDQINLNRTMFNGGTGLLSKGLITRRLLRSGWIVSALLAIAVSALLVIVFEYHWLLIASCALGLFLGLEYSFPPIRFSRRGLGEAAAFFAYGVPVMFVGLVLQVDRGVMSALVSDFRLYLMAMPVSLSVFAVLCLTQIPDTDADGSVGKKSVSVLFGQKNVLILAALVLFICVMLFITFTTLRMISIPFGVLALLMPLMTGIFILRNLDAYSVPAGRTMINIMGMSVTSSILCALIPALYFLLNHEQVLLL
jgi:putative NADPH-quinone reductase/1,4-dihydroxy-2-naphthoate octaprenyltransferase